MRLTLTVLRCPPAVAPETRTLEGGEFSVGRGPGVDWVLADTEQMVSRRHFSAAFRGGDWQIADESSNGTFVNHDGAPIGKGNRRTLRDHDRLRAGPYEIEVHLEELEAHRQSHSYGHTDPEPYGYADPAPAGHVDTIPEDAFDDQFHESFGSLDKAPSLGTPFVQQTQADHSSILEDAMRPPMPTGETHSLTGGTIPTDDLLPDNWEKDLLEGIGGPAPAANPIPMDVSTAHPPPAQPPPMAPFQEPPFAENPFEPGPLEPTPFAPKPAELEPPLAAPGPVARTDVPPIHAAPIEASPPDPFAEPPIQPKPAPPIAAPPISPADTDLLSAFLQGVGLPDAKPTDPGVTLRHLGEAFRSLVAGLRAVLIARASIKSEFRIEQTLIRARGNNPLKFSADDDDAISALLGVGRRTDMTPATAVNDALRDIRLHELASMAAMQTAVRAVLDGLHPDKVRASAEQAGGLNVLPGQRKARAWDVYEALHTRTVQALSDDFDSVFGKAFARAYEDALDDLSAKEGK